MCYNDNDKFETILKVPKFNNGDKCSTAMFDIEIQNDMLKFEFSIFVINSQCASYVLTIRSRSSMFQVSFRLLW